MTEKEAIIIGRIVQEQAYQQMRNRRALRVGLVQTSGRNPDISFQEGGAIGGVPQIGSLNRYGWAVGASVLSLTVNGDIQMAANLGTSPYWTGEYEEVDETE